MRETTGPRGPAGPPPPRPHRAWRARCDPARSRPARRRSPVDRAAGRLPVCWSRPSAGSVYLLGTLRDLDPLIELATDPSRLRAMSWVLGVGLGVWTTQRARDVPVRPSAGGTSAAHRVGRRPRGAGLRRGRAAGGALDARRDRAGRPGRDALHREPHRHRSARHQRREPLGRSRAREHPAARGRRVGRARRRAHRLGDAPGHRHRIGSVGDVQPAAQHDVRAVPRGQPAARRLPRGLHQRLRPGQRDAQRHLRAGAGDATPASWASPTTRAPTSSSRPWPAASASPSTTTCW